MIPDLAVFINAIIGFVLQLVVLALVPLVVYVVRRRSLRGFFDWLGVKAPPLKAIMLAMLLGVVLAAIKLPLLWPILTAESTVSGELLRLRDQSGWSVWLIGTLLVTAWLKTGLTEELFFRGFVGTRLINGLGFAWGNIAQAAIFGLVHVPIAFVVPEDVRTPALVVIIVLAPTVGGWAMGYVNHRFADDSFLPSWCMHGLGNTIAYAAPLLAVPATAGA